MMAKNIKKPLLLLPVVILSAFLSCGQAQNDGFNAPADSEVKLPDDITVESAGGGSWIIKVEVVGPYKDASGDIITGPLSGIMLQLGCADCTVEDKTDGSDYITVDTPTEIVATPYLVKTNIMGFYQVIVNVPSPVDLGLKKIEAQFWANAGVNDDEMKITINAPAE